MDIRECTVTLFLSGYCMTINMYLDMDNSIEEQIFSKYEHYGLKDFNWFEKDYQGETV